MTLLIIAQKVDLNDDSYGFFHKWLEEIANKTDKVLVLATEVGKVSLPENTKVYSLGKEKKFPGILRLMLFLTYLIRFFLYVDSFFIFHSLL